MEENTLRIPLDDNTSSFLDKDWLTPAELEERSRLTIRQAQIHRAFQPESSIQEYPPEDTTLERPSSSKPKSVSFTEDQPLVSNVFNPTLLMVPMDDSSSTLIPHRSERSNKGSHQSIRYINEVFLASITGHQPSSTIANLAYNAELESDFDNEKSTVLILDHMLQNLKPTMDKTLLIIWQ